MAMSRDGKCLSKQYRNGRTKLIWECDKGHKFEKSPSEVKKGRWCPNYKKTTYNKI